MGRLILLVPFVYFIKTRLNNSKAWVFHSYYEWIPNIVILYYFVFSDTWSLAIIKFSISYLAFISIYEIGYLINDQYAIKFEEKPRLRLGVNTIKHWQRFLFIAIRLLVFSVCSYNLGVHNDYNWLVFYSLLSLSFLLHNFLTVNAYKVMTFVSLAIFRFMSPIFIFINENDLAIILTPILLTYVVFRMLIYMDSKGLLNMPKRKSSEFKLYYYLLLLPIHLFLSFTLNSPIPIVILMYYMLFTLANHLLSKDRKHVI